MLLAREIERPSHRKRFCHARFRGAITDHDVHLVGLPAKKDGSDSASAGEALEAWSMNGNQLLERRATRLPGCATGGHGGSPTNDHNHCTSGGDAVCGDLALRRPWPNARCPDHEQRSWIGHGTGRGSLDPLPPSWNDEPDAVPRDDPPAVARQCAWGEDDEA
jgi:hypothetical protein